MFNILKREVFIELNNTKTIVDNDGMGMEVQLDKPEEGMGGITWYQ